MRDFKNGDCVIWNYRDKKIKAKIHHLSVQGFGLMAFLEANEKDVGYETSGCWYMVSLNDLEYYINK